jgi:uncharacterized protein (TIGR03083 family)
MAEAAVWSMIAAERKALAADLGSLDEASWSKPSLCEKWTVRDVVAHMTATAKITSPAFVGKMIASGFSLKKLQAKDIVSERGDSPGDTLARFKAVVDSTKHPPGPLDAWLGEAIVHSEDIRRPLGIAHDYPTEASVRVADFYKRSNLLIGTKKRIDGLRLVATDVDWSHGHGPEVSGTIVALVVAMTGRKAALADLTGDGVTMLSARS